jgi:hypothetical protein
MLCSPAASEMAFHVESGLWGLYNRCAVGTRRIQGKPITRDHDPVVGFNSNLLGQRLFGCSRAYIVPI